MNPIRKFEIWAKEFAMEDDGVRAFMAMEKIERISFEFALKEEGWIARVEDILAE